MPFAILLVVQLVIAVGASLAVRHEFDKEPTLSQVFVENSPNIFAIYDINDNLKGSSIAVRSPVTNKTYIITNEHVCRDRPVHTVTNANHFRIAVKTLFADELNDLCILTAPPEVTGIEINQDPDVLSNVYVFGYPEGVFMGFVGTYQYVIEHKDDQFRMSVCKQLNIEPIIRFTELGLPEQVCQIVRDKALAVAPVYYGSSGGPWIGADGKLVAITAQIRHYTYSLGVPSSIITKAFQINNL